MIKDIRDAIGFGILWVVIATATIVVCALPFMLAIRILNLLFGL